ncbi:MAG: phosphoribosylanthranilate isomerase [Acidobacteriota bacterium]
MTKVKICGITNLDDALMSVDAGADAIGFNFYEKSPRFIAPDAASYIISKLPPKILKVGVFVDCGLKETERILSTTPLDFVQLHGEEGPDFVNRLVTLTGSKVIKVIRVSTHANFTAVADYDVAHFLLDTYSSAFGGSGETFDWESAVKFKDLAHAFYLAGGLTPENVGEAIRKVRPFAVDVCSGVESTKGRKDPSKVAAFIRNAKSAL